MRVLFMGTPEIAATALSALLEDGLDIVGCVSQPDRPKGRGMVLTPPPVKVLAMERGIPIVSALGTGNKLDASLLRLCDISKTEGCPLARVVRKELRKRGINHHAVVFSPEEGVKAEQREAPPPGRRSVPGSLVWVPAAAGLLLAQKVVLDIGEIEY